MTSKIEIFFSKFDHFGDLNFDYVIFADFEVFDICTWLKLPRATWIFNIFLKIIPNRLSKTTNLKIMVETFKKQQNRTLENLLKNTPKYQKFRICHICYI